MNLSVVVLNWHAAVDTIACLTPLLAWREIRPLLIVVDNASNDGSADEIAVALPDITLIRNDTNQGFAGGSNRGIEAALAQQDAPVLLLNNDARIAEADAQRLLTTLQAHPDVGLIVPQLVDEAGQLIAIGGKDPARHINTRVQAFADDAPVQRVETVSGTAVVIRPQVLRQAGLLDERFFFSTELADLCLRARRHGWRCAVEWRARATHEVERSSALRDSLYVYYIVRNRFLILRNHHHRRVDLRAFWHAYTVALWLKLTLTGPAVTARAVGLAWRDAVNGRFGNQNTRVLAHCGVTVPQQ